MLHCIQSQEFNLKINYEILYITAAHQISISTEFRRDIQKFYLNSFEHL